MTSPRTTDCWIMTARDPIVVRDGRPFGVDSGRRMKSLGWPLPSMIAGSVRTAIGRERGGAFDVAAFRDALKQVVVHGPFPNVGGRLHFPAPADALRKGASEGRKVLPRMLAADEGVDTPYGLLPALPDGDLVGLKLPQVPAWWSQEKVEGWLAQAGAEPVEKFFEGTDQFLNPPEQDQRSHVSIDTGSFSSQDGLLFSSSGLILDQVIASLGQSLTRYGTPRPIAADVQLSLRLRSIAESPLPEMVDDWMTVGGERRIAQIKSAPSDAADQWTCPVALTEALRSGDRWRMVLASPAIFENGWYPGWLQPQDGMLQGTLPGTDLRFRLISVCNQRWQPVSGWSYEPLPGTGRPGPKPVRRMTPAGSVFFFERLPSAMTTDPAKLWLEPVSDDSQDCRDGFGLALWGVW